MIRRPIMGLDIKELDDTQREKERRINCLEHKLEDWYNQTYKGNELEKRCCPSLKVSYRGILRV